MDLISGKILYEGLSKDGVYPILASSSLSSNSSISTACTSSQVHPTSSALSSATSAQISLWHKRLGHPSAKLLHSAIQPVNVAFTFNKIDECCSSCTSCISAKMHRFPLNKHDIQSTSMLQIVHSDVWGPTPISSSFGYSYYVVFIDDFTRYTWFFLLKQKSELFVVFKHFQNLVETQYFAKIKILKSDNGREYLNSQFQQFCSESGIVHQTSCPYVPQQNGVSERKHRHIVDTGLAYCISLTYL